MKGLAARVWAPPQAVVEQELAVLPLQAVAEVEAALPLQPEAAFQRLEVAVGAGVEAGAPAVLGLPSEVLLHGADVDDEPEHAPPSVRRKRLVQRELHRIVRGHKTP